jgi:uncharacterized protein
MAQVPGPATTATTTYDEITSEMQLRDLLGVPKPRAVAKERTRLHPIDRQWLAASPFCVIATCDADGKCDASPKGDPAGQLLHVLDDTTIAVAERPGNRRADGYLNVLSNPHVGILSLVPGRNETLRINGRARLFRDAPFFDDLIVKGQRPVIALLVQIDQVFFHCAKAFMRSNLWQPGTWHPEVLAQNAALLKCAFNLSDSREELKRYYAPENVEKRLYQDS